MTEKKKTGGSPVMIYCGLSDEDLRTITDGCVSERQELVERIRKTREIEAFVKAKDEKYSDDERCETCNHPGSCQRLIRNPAIKRCGDYSHKDGSP